MVHQMPLRLAVRRAEREKPYAGVGCDGDLGQSAEQFASGNSRMPKQG
jgi:hypothetical protein